jgi:hypothetical protein
MSFSLGSLGHTPTSGLALWICDLAPAPSHISYFLLHFYPLPEEATRSPAPSRWSGTELGLNSIGQVDEWVGFSAL